MMHQILRRLAWVWVLLMLTALPGCGDSNSDGNTPAENTANTILDTPTDTTTDNPADTPTDTPTDSTTDTPADSTTDTTTDIPTGTPTDNPVADPVVTEVNPATLDSAASFLAAATGKENRIEVDQVVFVNTVLGINQPVQNVSMSAHSGDSGNGSSNDSSMGCLYGDLWVTLRDENGVPILDGQGCEQPIASPPIELPLLDANGDPILDSNGDPATYFRTTVPMILEDFQDGEQKCSVVEEYADRTIPVELGRLNMVRSSVKNPDTMARAFEEAMKNINASVALKSDLSGRLVLVSKKDVFDDNGNAIGTKIVEATIDSPRENLALYRALMVYGRLAGFGVEKIGEEGQTMPAPWLEIRPDLELGELAYLREGTPGRDHGVDLIDNYADLSVVFHATELDYAGRFADYVQFHAEGDPDNSCPYTDENDEIWSRVFDKDSYQGENINGFARHADDARRMIVFMHNIIQDVPHDGAMPSFDAELRGDNDRHLLMPEILADEYTRHLMFETAASALGAAASKGVPLSTDATVFINTVLGINQLGEVSPKDLYGDLWILKRDADGVPLLDEELGCVIPIASETIYYPTVDENGVTEEIEMDTVPMVLEEYMDGLFKCAPEIGYEDYVMEVEMGRLNCARSSLNNPGMMDRHLFEVVNRINKAVEIKRDLAGRIVLTTEKTVYDDEGNVVDVIRTDASIDSPLENMAIYRALMKSGTLEVPVTVNIEGTKETFTLGITLSDEVLDKHGMGYLKYGDNPPSQPIGIGHHDNGYADFTEVSHCPKADYEGVRADFVERQDGVCPYGDRNDDIWTRVLDAGNRC